MPADAVTEIKARLDILEVVGQYVRLQRSGRQHMGLCPFHAERTPSFSVSQERQAWYCFGCQEGGDLISFVEKVEHLDFLQALEMLAERAGVELERDRGPGRRQASERRRRALDLHTRAQAFYEQVLWATDAGAAGRELLAERGVSEELARQFGLGFAPSGGPAGDALVRYLVARGHGTAADVAAAGLAHETDRGGHARDRFRHRLVFPIRDERGAIIAFGGRALNDAMPKYLNSPATAVYDKSTALFGVDLARAAMVKESTAVVVEGYFDVLAAHHAGVTHTVASSGTALTRQQVHTLARHAKLIVLCFDSDDAGRAASSRAVDVIAAEGLDARICLLPGGAKDPDELCQRDPAAFVASIATAEPEWQVLLERAIGDAEGGSVEARRQAVERSIAVLARIPESATRTLYVQRAARRLDVAAAALGADVDRARTAPSRSPRVIAAAPSPPAVAGADGDGLSDGDAGTPPSSWEAYLGRLVVQRPSLAALLRDAHGLRGEELEHPGVARIVTRAQSLPDHAAFPLESIAPADRQLATHHLYRPVPELDDAEDPSRLAHAISECVHRVRISAKEHALAAKLREKRRAADDGRADDVERLAEELQQLSAELHHIRAEPAGV
ncbi:MAG TPA: DNA primase [Candidatus Dormibacteraeota bacterium]|jgi:DNA primase|nr:DNA primase [Candidatus Dormibacteraeota bacterium]